jgi:hypothetical protein
MGFRHCCLFEGTTAVGGCHSPEGVDSDRRSIAQCVPSSCETACAAKLEQQCNSQCTASADATCTSNCKSDCTTTCADLRGLAAGDGVGARLVCARDACGTLRDVETGAFRGAGRFVAKLGVATCARLGVTAPHSRSPGAAMLRVSAGGSRDVEAGHGDGTGDRGRWRSGEQPRRESGHGERAAAEGDRPRREGGHGEKREGGHGQKRQLRDGYLLHVGLRVGPRGSGPSLKNALSLPSSPYVRVPASQLTSSSTAKNSLRSGRRVSRMTRKNWRTAIGESWLASAALRSVRPLSSPIRWVIRPTASGDITGHRRQSTTATYRSALPSVSA